MPAFAGSNPAAPASKLIVPTGGAGSNPAAPAKPNRELLAFGRMLAVSLPKFHQNWRGSDRPLDSLG